MLEGELKREPQKGRGKKREGKRDAAPKLLSGAANERKGCRKQT